MKNIALLVIGVLLAGCSKNHFEPEMKGVSFWESPQRIYDAFQQGSFDGIEECFSIFMVQAATSDWSDYRLEIKLGIGIPQKMAYRVTDSGYETLVRDEDITKVEWKNLDASHAQGAYDFDAFYGKGRVVFKALKKDDEWVINYIAIPRKNASDFDRPYVVFHLSEAEVATWVEGNR